MYDPAHLAEIQERLSLIYNLKKKYASSVNAPLSEVLTFFDDANRFIEENESGNDKKNVVKKVFSPPFFFDLICYNQRYSIEIHRY